MTQVVRQKWVVLLASANFALAVFVLILVAIAAGSVKRASRDLGPAQGNEIQGLRAEIESLHGMREELRGLQRAAPAAPDPQLAQTLQLIASEQQLLMLRALQQSTPPAAPPQAAAEPRRSRPKTSARRSPTQLRSGCSARAD